jgi:hypothetical protein
VNDKAIETVLESPAKPQWTALPLRDRVVDRLADILLAFNDISDMLEHDASLRPQLQPAIETIWKRINQFSVEVERDLLRDFAN